ncbi:MAG: gluconate 2-dehydrogenase subunit 3 family protein [Verrucomicrobiales bacterium]|nr:gluconate 2-dehydrogenase subunit 3 family protein [Verrucomicrobiales bacterium]
MDKDSTDARIDRRTALQWISAASVAIPSLDLQPAVAQDTTAVGYGSDPDLLKIYQPGDLWPLTFSDSQRHHMSVLCDLIIPAEDSSPAASELGVHDFIDEWISSPYPGQKADRNLILKGLNHLELEEFFEKTPEEQFSICSEMAIAAKRNRREFPGSFFLRIRDLVSGGYFTTPEGMKDIGYRGNQAMPEWNGPPAEVLERLGLEPQ